MLLIMLICTCITTSHVAIITNSNQQLFRYGIKESMNATSCTKKLPDIADSMSDDNSIINYCVVRLCLVIFAIVNMDKNFS